MFSSLNTGVILAILASVGPVGTNIFRLYNNDNVFVETNSRKKCYFQILSLMGIALLLIGCIRDFIALAFAPQSLLAPLGALPIIWDVLFSVVWMKKQITWGTCKGVVLILIGINTSVMWYYPPEKILTLSTSFAYLFRYPFKVWLTLIIFATISMHLYCRSVIEKKMSIKQCMEKRREAERMQDYAKVALEINRLIQLQDLYRTHQICLRLCLGCLTGVFGGLLVMCFKIFSMLCYAFLQGSIDWNWSILVYLLIATLMYSCLNGCWSTVNSHFDSNESVPFCRMCFFVGSIITGGIYFQEFHNVSSSFALNYGVGLILTLWGVLLVDNIPFP